MGGGEEETFGLLAQNKPEGVGGRAYGEEEGGIGLAVSELGEGEGGEGVKGCEVGEVEGEVGDEGGQRGRTAKGRRA